MIFSLGTIGLVTDLAFKMTPYSKYRLKLRSLTKHQQKVDDENNKNLIAARKQKKNADEIQLLEHERCFDYKCIQEEIDVLITKYLRNRANKLFVPMPDYNDENMWDRCNTISDEKVLSTLGINTINKNIRAELNERSELVLKYLGILIGVIGAFTGLFAVILH